MGRLTHNSEKPEYFLLRPEVEQAYGYWDISKLVSHWQQLEQESAAANAVLME